MKKNRIFHLVLCVAVFALSGCASVISADLRGFAEPDLTFAQVKKDPEAYKSKVVVWGGEIVKTTNVEEGARIEILQKPLTFELMPEFGDKSHGRFIAMHRGYLDPAIYEKGREITVAGEILGKETARLDEIDYAYPLMEAEEIHLWPDRSEDLYWRPYPYYPGYRYDWRFGLYWHH